MLVGALHIIKKQKKQARIKITFFRQKQMLVTV